MGIFGKLLARVRNVRNDEREEEEEESNRYRFTMEDTEASHRTRKMRADIRNMRLEREKLYEEIKLETARMELQQVKADLFDDDEQEEEGITNNPDGMLGLMFSQILNAKQQTPIIPVMQNNAIEFTDEQLIKIKSAIPGIVLKQVNSMDDATITNLIKSHLPGISDNSISKAIAILKKT